MKKAFQDCVQKKSFWLEAICLTRQPRSYSAADWRSNLEKIGYKTVAQDWKAQYGTFRTSKISHSFIKITPGCRDLTDKVRIGNRF